ncbi:MAG TPA: CBS domain-containing protein [Rubrivivax sp.]
MTLVSEIMSTDVQTVGPEQSLRDAAQLMDRLNVGSLPVCAGRQIVGMVTDRDITVRGTAAGLTPDGGCVSDVMSPELRWCTADQDVEAVMDTMSDAQVRRLPVINLQRELVGIVALGDIATKSPNHVDDAVREISTPSQADGGAHNA